MKLRNKKTGEIAETFHNDIVINSNKVNVFHSLAELNEEWEDYEEIEKFKIEEFNDIAVGIAFNNKEEKDTFVENLKAWKRLKDSGLHFLGWNSTYKGDNVDFYLDWINSDSKEQLTKDLDLLFGGEE